MGGDTRSEMQAEMRSEMASMESAMSRLSTPELLLFLGALLVLAVEIVGRVILNGFGEGEAVAALMIVVVAAVYLRRFRGMAFAGGGLLTYSFILVFAGLLAGLFGLEDLRLWLAGNNLSGLDTILALLAILGELVMGAGGVWMLMSGPAS